MDSYTRCGEVYRRRYIEKEIIPPGFSLIKGTCVHTAAEEDFKQKIESKENLPAEQLVELAAASFDGRIKAEGVFLTEEEESIGKSKLMGEAKDSTVRMTREFAKSIAPRYQPVAVEEEFRIVLPGKRDILGRIDLRLESGIQDTKTGAKKKNQSDIDGDVQLTTYAAAFQTITGKPPTDIIIDNVVDRMSEKTQKVTTESHTFKTFRDQKDFEALARRINTITAGIEAGMFLPATPGAWWCSPTSCGYWRTCPYQNSERRAAADAVESKG
jgi:hypothetical protein